MNFPSTSCDNSNPSVREHSSFILSGLDSLKDKKVLCDVTLVAEGRSFPVHKVILASCSDYFKSMFTSGMKESSQHIIELKGVSAKGLEKVLEVVYKSKTILEGDDIFDLIGAATHLQVTPVIDYCESNFLSSMTPSNFHEFVQTAKLYNLNQALKQIDVFIVRNLGDIANDGGLKHLTSDQLLSAIRHPELRISEIQLFTVLWNWIRETGADRKMVRELMEQVRFALVSPKDIVEKVEKVEIMWNDDYCRELLVRAINYHLLPHSQPLEKQMSIHLRCPVRTVISVGGREINPTPGLHDGLFTIDLRLEEGHGRVPALGSTSAINRFELVNLPTVVSHMQIVVLNGYLYVLGGCLTQCAHGESATNAVHRWDPRIGSLGAWCQVGPMKERRAYFFSCALNEKLYVIGGKNRDGATASVEAYDPLSDRWDTLTALPAVYHAHAGTIYNNYIYISGGYSQGHFTPDLQVFSPESNQWDDLAPMTNARGWHSMAEVGGRLFVYGGCQLNPNQQAQPVTQTEYFNPATNQWTVVAPMSNFHKEASCIGHGQFVYILGGYNIQAKTGQKMVSRYDAKNDVWENMGQLPVGLTGVGYAVVDLPWSMVHPSGDGRSSPGS